MRFEDLKPGPNVRKALGDLGPLTASLKTFGLLCPILVEPNGTILAGHRRHAAIAKIRDEAIENGESPPFEDVSVMVLSDTEESGREDGGKDRHRISIQLAENDPRKALTAWELAQAIVDLRKTGLGEAEIGRRLGRAESYVSSLYCAASNAGDEVRAVLDKGLDPPVAILYKMSRVPEDKQLGVIEEWLEDAPPPRKRNGLHRRSALRRAGPKHLRTLIRDLKLAGPEWKPAIKVLRYILGETERRPVRSRMISVLPSDEE